MNRRELIKTFAALAPLTIAGRVWAAPATDARLLVVFLRGAYDAANVVAPVSSDFYHAARPTLAIAKPDVGNPNAALPLDAPCTGCSAVVSMAGGFSGSRSRSTSHICSRTATIRCWPTIAPCSPT